MLFLPKTHRMNMAIKSCYPFATQYFCAKVVDNFIKKRLDLRSVFANTLDASHRSIVTTLSWWLERWCFFGAWLKLTSYRKRKLWVQAPFLYLSHDCWTIFSLEFGQLFLKRPPPVPSNFAGRDASFTSLLFLSLSFQELQLKFFPRSSFQLFLDFKNFIYFFLGVSQKPTSFRTSVPPQKKSPTTLFLRKKKTHTSQQKQILDFRFHPNNLFFPQGHLYRASKASSFSDSDSPPEEPFWTNFTVFLFWVSPKAHLGEVIFERWVGQIEHFSDFFMWLLCFSFLASSLWREKRFSFATYSCWHLHISISEWFTRMLKSCLGKMS